MTTGRPIKHCGTCQGRGAPTGCPECDKLAAPEDGAPCPRCWLTSCDCDKEL